MEKGYYIESGTYLLDKFLESSNIPSRIFCISTPPTDLVSNGRVYKDFKRHMMGFIYSDKMRIRLVKIKQLKNEKYYSQNK
jgi:hypothetical protein